MTYYTRVFDVDPGSTNLSKQVEDEFELIEQGFADLESQLTIDFTAFNAALALKAPIASPAFTGEPTAPTPDLGDSSTRIATMAALAAAISASGALPTTAGHSDGEGLLIIGGLAAWGPISLSLTWTNLADKPTTLAGFGITNGQHAIEWLQAGRRVATAPARIDFRGARVQRRTADTITVTPDLPHNLLIAAGVH